MGGGVLAAGGWRLLGASASAAGAAAAWLAGVLARRARHHAHRRRGAVPSALGRRVACAVRLRPPAVGAAHVHAFAAHGRAWHVCCSHGWQLVWQRAVCYQPAAYWATKGATCCAAGGGRCGVQRCAASWPDPAFTNAIHASRVQQPHATPMRRAAAHLAAGSPAAQSWGPSPCPPSPACWAGHHRRMTIPQSPCAYRGSMIDLMSERARRSAWRGWERTCTHNLKPGDDLLHVHQALQRAHLITLMLTPSGSLLSAVLRPMSSSCSLQRARSARAGPVCMQHRRDPDAPVNRIE